MGNFIYYAFLGAVIVFIINYYDLSPKKSLLLAIVIGSLASILKNLIF